MNPATETEELLPIEPMNFSTKFAYGAGDIGGAIVGILLLSYLSPFFTDVAHLSPGLAGATQLVVRVWDAFIDPVIGIMSDRGNVFGAKIKEKWGRRYPWMLEFSPQCNCLLFYSRSGWRSVRFQPFH